MNRDLDLTIEDLKKEIKYMNSKLEDMENLERRINDIEMQMNRRRNPFMQKR